MDMNRIGLLLHVEEKVRGFPNLSNIKALVDKELAHNNVEAGEELKEMLADEQKKAAQAAAEKQQAADAEAQKAKNKERLDALSAQAQVAPAHIERRDTP